MQARAYFFQKKMCFMPKMQIFQFSIFNFQLKIVPLCPKLDYYAQIRIYINVSAWFGCM